MLSIKTIRAPRELLLLCSLFVPVQSSCNIDQRNHCMDLYRKKLWSGGVGGGGGGGNAAAEMTECAAKSYSEFTHVCSVNNYLPSIDHCCCVTREEEEDEDDDHHDDSSSSSNRNNNDDGDDHSSDERDLEAASRRSDANYDDRDGKRPSRRRTRRQSPGNHTDVRQGEGDGGTDPRTSLNPRSDRGHRARRSYGRQVSVMCCRYHQDWNRFRCQQTIDTLDTRFAHELLVQSNLESMTSSLLSYGFLLLVLVSLAAVVVCFVSRRRKRARMVKARKNNGDPTAAMRTNPPAVGPNAPGFEHFDETPPPYSPSGYYGPNFEAHRGSSRPLIPAETSRLEPSAPMGEEEEEEDGGMEEALLLQTQGLDFFLCPSGRQEQLDSIETTQTTLTLLSREDDDDNDDEVLTSRLFPNEFHPFSSSCHGDDARCCCRCDAGGDDCRCDMRDLEMVRPGAAAGRGRAGGGGGGKHLDCRPVLVPVQSSSESPNLLRDSRPSPPPTYEQSMGVV